MILACARVGQAGGFLLGMEWGIGATPKDELGGGAQVRRWEKASRQMTGELGLLGPP